MSYNFPDSPTVGQVFVPAGGPSWTWTGSAWAATQSKTPTADSYNRIVNGAMQISQENGNTVSAITASQAGYYVADQWFARWSVSPGTASAIRQTGATPSGSASMANVTVGTAKAALAAGDYFVLTTWIEGNRIADLQWGTASAKKVVVRFWIYATVSGLYSFRIGNASVTTRCYVHQFTIPTANTWTQINAVVSGDTTGTWASDNTQGITFEVVFAVGSTFTGSVVDAWQAGNIFAGPGQINGMATASAVFYIADVGLYADPNSTGVAPPWVTPDYASELQACLRYWETGSSRWDGMATSAVLASTQIWFKAWKRIAPTMSGASTSAVSFPATPNYSSANSSNCLDYRTANASAAGSFSSNWIANSRM